MEEIVVQATRRNVIGKQVKALRREGKLPAVLYGHGISPVPVLLDLREASRTLNPLGTSVLITIDLDGEQHKALVREKQRDFIRGTLKHIDFQVVSMLEKIRVAVPIVLEGEAPAVKEFSGIVVPNIEEVEVESLPGDLPERLVVNISGLKAIGDSIAVRDISRPANVEILEDPNEIVVVITAPEAEEVAPVAEAAEGEPEVIEKGKKEEEEE